MLSAPDSKKQLRHKKEMPQARQPPQKSRKKTGKEAEGLWTAFRSGMIKRIGKNENFYTAGKEFGCGKRRFEQFVEQTARISAFFAAMHKDASE